MPAPLPRGANAALTREIPGLKRVTLGVQWDAGNDDVLHGSLVMTTLLCDADSRALSPEHLVFFNQLSSPEESVVQAEQALGGDQEQVIVDLAAVPEEVDRVLVAFYVNDSPGQHRTLGRLRSLRVRAVDADSDSELVRSEDLAAALDREDALTLGELYRHAGGWKFKVLGLGYTGGITALARDHGLTL
ncbi:TerD family protein [Nocardioides sp.]|uniref:TerD family protein n=1 Tax=Nocardioides sp. TaxID=35761 RepID=UPI00351941F5